MSSSFYFIFSFTNQRRSWNGCFWGPYPELLAQFLSGLLFSSMRRACYAQGKYHDSWLLSVIRGPDTQRVCFSLGYSLCKADFYSALVFSNLSSSSSSPPNITFFLEYLTTTERLLYWPFTLEGNRYAELSFLVPNSGSWQWRERKANKFVPHLFLLRIAPLRQEDREWGPQESRTKIGK